MSVRRKTLKTSGKPDRQCKCLFQWPATNFCHQRSGPSRLAGTDPSNSDMVTAVCVCARVCMGACTCTHVHVSVRACVHGCVRACVPDVFAIYDNFNTATLHSRSVPGNLRGPPTTSERPAEFKRKWKKKKFSIKLHI